MGSRDVAIERQTELTPEETLENTAHDALPEGLLSHPAARLVIREIAWRFAYLRRVVINEMSRVLTPLGATVPQYHVLFRLATAEGPLSQQELTLDAGLDAAGISRLVARMANEKLVTIKVDTRDRRRRLVKLTAKGRALEESLSPLIDGAVRSGLPSFSPDEATFLMEMLERACTGAMEREVERKRRSRRRPASGSEPSRA